MDWRVNRITRLAAEVVLLEDRLGVVAQQVDTARQTLESDGLTYQAWAQAAHEYGMASGSMFCLENRLKIVRGRLHFAVDAL